MQVNWYHLAMYQRTTEHLTQNPHHTSKCGLLPHRVETIVQIMENIQFWSEKSLPHLTISIKSSVTLKLYGPDPLENCHLNVKKMLKKWQFLTFKWQFSGGSGTDPMYPILPQHTSHPRKIQRASMQLTRVVLGPV